MVMMAKTVIIVQKLLPQRSTLVNLEAIIVEDEIRQIMMVKLRVYKN